MATSDTERERLRQAQTHLEGWKYEARDQAYSEFFEGPDAVLTGEELNLLDRIDSALVRQTGDGFWGADEYGIAPTTIDDEGPQVVCIYHPEIPYEGYRGEESLDDPTRDQLNDVLWEYAERVARLIQEELDDYLAGRHAPEE
ncbi:DUF7539 family protein [Haloarchaeobius sp. HRN-SO-5]|uniref:DUF7539 family protein n=1 Tax=Haloarchaeobius sp. HRN-SO-5 TaxID=3446118 RepID=UPI003EB79FB5